MPYVPNTMTPTLRALSLHVSNIQKHTIIVT